MGSGGERLRSQGCDAPAAQVQHLGANECGMRHGQLDARRALSLDEYEACERTLLSATCARDYTPPADLMPSLYESHYRGQHKLVFRGTRQYYREYAWS